MNYKHAIESMRYRARTTQLRLPLVWSRHWKIKRHDAFVASYPRSGNTWSRFLLCEVLTKGKADFQSVIFTIPSLRLRSLYGTIPAVLPGEGRLLRTHEGYSRAYKKAVYFVRDPRDIVVSNYEFERGLPHFRAKSFDDFLNLFVRGKINAFGSWRKHVISWLDSPLAAGNDFLLIRYEDMRRDTEGVLAKIVEFLGVSVGREKIRRAVANNCLERMRQKEDRSRGWSPECGATIEAGRQVRVGSVGGWQDRLSAAQVDLIEHHAGDLMTRLGYASRSDIALGFRDTPLEANGKLLDADLAS
jgi:hypothetical protein